MVKIGLIGVGDISKIYLKNIYEVFNKQIKLVCACDLIKEKALEAQKEYGFKVYDTMYEVINDPEVELILNLTRPAQHYGVSKAALLGGKHCYSEKPLAASLEEADELVKIANEKGLYLGGAPDTFMGSAIQTCRELLDSKIFGEVIGGRAAMQSHGMEHWHPDPDFFYQYGGGPLFDMGPYYITCLINLLGGIEKVFGVAETPEKERIIKSSLHKGEIIHVTVPTHIESILYFKSGIHVSLATSFNVWKSSQTNIELFTTKGTLVVPDPNNFKGEITFFSSETKEWEKYPLAFDYDTNARALGLTDFARAIETGRESRITYQQTYHVLETMCSIMKSAKEEKIIKLKSTFERKAPMIKDLPYGELE